MPICPECRLSAMAIDGAACTRCGWEPTSEDGVPSFLSRRDRESGLLNAYCRLYESIAEDDLESSIQGDDALAIEAERLGAILGNLRGCDVCEIGVGKGFLLERVRQAQPARLVGVDLARAYLRRLQGNADGVQLMRANAENLPFREEFDVIVASDVMEHVLNLADFLASATEALRPGGRLVVKTPYREDITQYSRLSGCPYPLVHLRTFDRAMLRQLLVNAGLEVKRLSYTGFYLGRWRPLIARLPPLRVRVKRMLERRFGDNPNVNRIRPWLGLVLMRPTEIVAVASKPNGASGKR